MSNKLCRICLETTNLFNIFKEDVNIASKIMAICDIEIDKTDNLPKFVCSNCVKKIEEFLEFKNQIENNHQYLLTIDWLPENVEIKENPKEILFENSDYIEEEVTKDEDEPAQSKYEIYSDISQENEEEHLIVDNKKNHKEKQPIQCNICGRLLSTKFRLKCHIRTHTGEKPFRCTTCNKSFSLSYNLKIHQRVHTGEKPIECHVCSKKFSQATGLISHLRLHTGENPYKCHLCSKGFKTTSHLKYHIRLHTGEKNYACTICKKAFIAKSDLSQHMKTHTGERPHVCTICGARLGRAYHLERHMLIHTGERKYKCDDCGQAYAQSYDLKRHKKVHIESIKKKFNKFAESSNSTDKNMLLEIVLINSESVTEKCS